MKKDKKEILDTLREEFRAIGVKSIDSKNRINLGGKVLKLVFTKTKADAYKVFVGEEGDILLRPVVTIPSREAWVYRSPKVLKQIRQGLTEAKQGKTEKVEDLDEFLEKL